jgi:monothiol glutaredoxin
MATTTLVESIQAEIAANKICIFSKGTKEIPRCGFTMETKEYFDRLGYDYLMIDVLDDMEKREALTEMTQWRTLPKVFINGQFCGDTDTLAEMEASGELQTLLKTAFGH